MKVLWIIALIPLLIVSHGIGYLAGQSSIRRNLIVMDIWEGKGPHSGFSLGYYGECAKVGEASYCATLKNN